MQAWCDSSVGCFKEDGWENREGGGGPFCQECDRVSSIFLMSQPEMAARMVERGGAVRTKADGSRLMPHPRLSRLDIELHHLGQSRFPTCESDQ